MNYPQPPAALVAKWREEAEKMYPEIPDQAHSIKGLINSHKRDAHIEACRKRWKDAKQFSCEDVIQSDFTIWVFANKWQYDHEARKWFNNYIGEVTGLYLSYNQLKQLFLSRQPLPPLPQPQKEGGE